MVRRQNRDARIPWHACREPARHALRHPRQFRKGDTLDRLLPLNLKGNVVGELAGRFLESLVEGGHRSKEILQGRTSEAKPARSSSHRFSLYCYSESHATETHFFCILALFVPVLCTAQSRDSKAEALASCAALIEPTPLTPYGFAKAVLVSLWYARNAAEGGNETEQAGKESDNYFSYVTALMRINRTTNDFICARKSVKPFSVKAAGENISTAAKFFAITYDEHIRLNQRLIDVLKKLDSTKQFELTDQISTLQVERGQRWADLIRPTGLALTLLIDLKHADENGKANRLIITKAQRQTLLDWANDHFQEFKNGTPKDQWSDPAKTANLYFTFFEGRKCVDE